MQPNFISPVFAQAPRGIAAMRRRNHQIFNNHNFTNMPVPISMGVSLTTTQLDAIKLNIKSIKDVLNNLITINLTKDERSGIQSVAEKRFPYVETAYDTLIDNYPNLQPSFGNVTEAKSDYTYLTQHRQLGLLLLELLEISSDHELSAGYRAFEYMRDFYDVAERATERNVPGADTVVDALSPLFKQANDAAPTTPTE